MLVSDGPLTRPRVSTGSWKATVSLFIFFNTNFLERRNCFALLCQHQPLVNHNVPSQMLSTALATTYFFKFPIPAKTSLSCNLLHTLKIAGVLVSMAELRVICVRKSQISILLKCH